MAMGQVAEKNQDATIYVSNVDEKADESLLWDLFIQTGQVVNIHLPKDRISQKHQGYGFVEFMTEEDANYTIGIMNLIKLYDKTIRISKANANQKNFDIGANLFIGQIDPEMDEKLLFDTFRGFGAILNTPKVLSMDGVTGYAFVNYASFEAADAAKETMNGQYLANKIIKVDYAFKKDNKGERHGTVAERLLASQNPHPQAGMPHQHFGTAAPMMPILAAPGMPVVPFSMIPAMIPPQNLPMHGLRMPPASMMHLPPSMMAPHGSMMAPPVPHGYGSFPAPIGAMAAGWRPPPPNGMLPPPPNGMMLPHPNGMMLPHPNGMLPPPPNGVMAPHPNGMMPPPPPPNGMLPPPPNGMMPPPPNGMMPPPPNGMMPPPPNGMMPPPPNGVMPPPPPNGMMPPPPNGVMAPLPPPPSSLMPPPLPPQM